MMKIFAAFLIVLLAILQYKFWFEEGGFAHNRQLKKQLEVMQAENDKLKQRNLELARKIILVKEDLNEIEALARRNLGMVKEGEQFMFIIEDKNKAQAEAPVQSQSQPGQPPVPENTSTGNIIRE